MVRFTFNGIKNQAKDKGLIIEKNNRVYELWHPDYPVFGVSELSNLHECMSEIMSFSPKHYQSDDKGRYSDVSCLT